MARLRTIARTSAFSWNPDSGIPLIVTGTRAGAIDAEFSDETKLELWDLSLDDPDQTVELQPIASFSTDSRFHDIAWSPPNVDHPRGIIAGALENGSLHLWDAEKFINKADDSLISQTKKHTGPIKSLEFNPHKPQILATAGTKGELFIYDINDIANPFRLGTAGARSDDLECVAWNRKLPHILATGGSGGFVTVWDLKSKKASFTLNNNRKAVGAIAWDPENSTKLLTATPDDSTPVILLWDLRNSNAPECILQGHNQGVLSISWCQQDKNLLLSSGKDNRTILWNPQTGELLGEFPELTNWTFQTRFHPHNPALSATASFDGKISIQTLYNTNPIVTQSQAQNAVDGEDFFTKVQTQPQGTSFSLKVAPKWLERPSGVSFGFGGKLVSFNQLITTTSQRASKIQITQYSVDSNIESAIQAFEKAHQSGDAKLICQNHISEATSDEEKACWKTLETLTSEDPRKQVAKYLGFSEIQLESIGEFTPDKPTVEDTTEITEAKNTKENRLSTLFADGADGEDFLSNLAATKGAKTDNPFHIFSQSDSESEKQIAQALILGQFEKAMGICLNEDRIADALIIANCGGKSLLDKAQSLYLSKKTEGPNYLRLLTSIIGKNLWDIVYNADLVNWKETIVTLCTYADPNEFPDLCETLGDRIMEHNLPKDASFCYLVGSKLEKVVPIWLNQLHETEKAEIENLCGDSIYSVHAHSIQNFIEKVTLFRDITKFQDTELNNKSGWKLSPLYATYVEYADIAAAHGHLETAERYLDLLPTDYPGAEAARNRVKIVSKKSASELKREQTPNSANSQPLLTAANNYEPIGSKSAIIPPRSSSNAYAPPTPTLVGNPYAPVVNSSVPTQQFYQNPHEGGYGTPAVSYGAPAPSFMAPPRKPITSAPPRAKDVGQWNDTPMVVKPPTARRSTPAAPGTIPLSTQHNMSIPTATPNYGNSRAVATPPPPPPKGPAPPRLTSPPVAGPQHLQQTPALVGSHQLQQTPALANVPATSQYTSPIGPSAQQFNQAGNAPMIPRGISPYNAPPVASTSNKYVPAAATAQQPLQAQGVNSQIAPPQHSGNRASYSTNPYSLPQNTLPNQHSSPISQYDNTQASSFANIQQTKSHGPSVNIPPRNNSQTQIQSTNPVSTSAMKAKYPAGDRSHIPLNARRMVEIFTEDMHRVASQAPSSFAPQVKDTQKRLNILFDHLNNEELIKPDTIQRLNELAEALKTKNYDIATKLQVDIQKEKTEECGNWMVGVKRLISMSKVTP